MRVTQRIQFYWVVLLLLAGSICTAAPTIDVFVLHSYSQEYAWTHGQNEGFVNELKRDSPLDFTIKTEYLDTKRHAYDSAYASDFASHLQAKYTGYKPAAIYVLSYLQGKPISELPATLKSPNAFVFDDQVLLRYNVLLSLISNDAILLNTRQGFYHSHRVFILGSLVCLAVLLLVAVIVSFVILVRKNHELQESEQSYRLQFAKNSSIMLLVDPKSNGLIIDANEAALQFYGYSRTELLSLHISDINQLSHESITGENLFSQT